MPDPGLRAGVPGQNEIRERPVREVELQHGGGVAEDPLDGS